MPDPTPLDELMTAWRKLGEESLTAVRRAFDAGRAQSFGGSAAADASPPSGDAPPPPPADEPPAAPPPDIAHDLRAILERVESIDERLAHIEASLAALTLVDDDVSWIDDDDYDDEDILPVRGMELRVKGMKRGRKRRKK